MSELYTGRAPTPHESDWVLICGHLGPLPYHLYSEEPLTAEYLKSLGILVPDGTAPRTPIHWMALCSRCRLVTPGNLQGPAEIRKLKDLRDDGNYIVSNGK